MLHDNFDQFTKEFHELVTQEYNVQRLFLSTVDEKKPEEELLQGMANTNAYGVLTSDFNNYWLELYNLTEGFRRLWGSISIRTELLLKWKYGITVDDFQKNLHEVINLDLNAKGPVPFTAVEIGQSRRLESDPANPGRHLDFWLYTLAFFRLTLNHSPNLKSYIDARQHRAVGIRPPR